MIEGSNIKLLWCDIGFQISIFLCVVGLSTICMSIVYIKVSVSAAVIAVSVKP